MKQTDWKIFDGGRMRIRAEYGMSKIGDQEPYFSITGETERGGPVLWREDSGGCLHDQIAERFPKLSYLIKWHRCFETSGPMHYVANATYWWEIATGRRTNSEYGPDPVKAFASTVVLGAVNDEDALPEVKDHGDGVVVMSVRGHGSNGGKSDDFDWHTELCSTADVEAFLVKRLPLLMAQFTADMRSAGVMPELSK